MCTLRKGQRSTRTPQFHDGCFLAGAVAASALAQPKAGSATTAMLRASQPGAVQLTSGSAVAPHVGAVAAATGLHGAVQPRALIPVRPTNPVTPPATRPASPAVTSVLHNQSDPHRAVHPSQPSTSAGTTVQITIQQPRNVHEMQPRPTMLSQQQLPKQLVGSQPILQPAQLAQTQKVIMTQAASSPVMHSGVTPTTLSAAKLSTRHCFSRKSKLFVVFSPNSIAAISA